VSSNSMWSDLPAGALKDLTLASVNFTGLNFRIGKHMGSTRMAFHFLSVHNNQPPFAFSEEIARKCASHFTPLPMKKLTVNQPSYDFEGSSPSSPTNLFNDLGRW
jgi:hypothetical protein